MLFAAARDFSSRDRVSLRSQENSLVTGRTARTRRMDGRPARGPRVLGVQTTDGPAGRWLSRYGLSTVTRHFFRSPSRPARQPCSCALRRTGSVQTPGAPRGSASWKGGGARENLARTTSFLLPGKPGGLWLYGYQGGHPERLCDLPGASQASEQQSRNSNPHQARASPPPPAAALGRAALRALLCVRLLPPDPGLRGGQGAGLCPPPGPGLGTQWGLGDGHGRVGGFKARWRVQGAGSEEVVIPASWGSSRSPGVSASGLWPSSGAGNLEQGHSCCPLWHRDQRDQGWGNRGGEV